MSTRAIKKLIKKDDLKELEKINELAKKKLANRGINHDEDEEEQDDVDDLQEANAIPINKFNLVKV